MRNKLLLMSCPRKQSQSISKISSDWVWSDYWGQVKCRISGLRMRYTVKPGLYALGGPGQDSDVFASANYKLSLDILRRELKGLNVWILVLDTNGINVWCAAGKGTFGTAELVKRIQEARLHEIVSHKRIILPQLSAPGVNVKKVHNMTGFKVHFGPVYAKDIPTYLNAGYRKTSEMRCVKFPFLDRLILTPMEIIPAMKKYPLFALPVLVLFGLEPSGIIFSKAWSGGVPFLFFGLISVLSGALITPVMLPFVPFRSFAIKGWITGLLSLIVVSHFVTPSFVHAWTLYAAVYLFFPAASSFIALQFTGSTTFTGMSGVKKELRMAVPFYIGSALVSVLLLCLFKFHEWRII